MVVRGATNWTIEKEQEAFNRNLAELLTRHAGRFVLWRHGQPVSFFETFDSAYTQGLEEFGVDEIFLVAKVAISEPQPASVSWEAGVMFG